MEASKATDPLDPLDAAWAELQRLNLESYVAELDTRGFTVIPPEIASPDGLHKRLLDAILDIAERRTGVRPDLDTGATHENFAGRFGDYVGHKGDSPIGEYFQCLIFEGRVFEEALMNPVLLAMTTYLLGYSSVLSGMSCFVKGPNETPFAFHSDTLIPAPLPPHALICNATYLLTDFDRESGATAFVPGSHKWGRHPRAHEAVVCGPGANPRAVPAEGAAGSLLVWHGATWHGAYNRTAKGLRVSMPVLMARHNMRTEEELFGKVPQEMLDRNNARFAYLLQQGISYGFSSQEESEARSARAREVTEAYFEEMGLASEERIDFHLYG